MKKYANVDEAEMDLKQRIPAAIEEAEDAFWKVIMKHFPEAKTGDLDPMLTMKWQFMMEDVVGAWTWWNVAMANDEGGSL